MQTMISQKEDSKKKIIIVNNNMRIGGVQKALLNLLHEISSQYDITLYLLSSSGEYLDRVPPNVTVIGGDSLYKYFGMSQAECRGKAKDFCFRSALAVGAKVLGGRFAISIASALSPKLPAEYDCAISYMHDAERKALYGGCNEFVLTKIKASKKVAVVHCDYENCGSNYKSNNALYRKFDYIAACSDGCRRAFLRVLPHLEGKTKTVINCHNFEEIIALSKENTVTYDEEYTNVIIVARLSPEKGIDRALLALKYVLEKGLKVRLHIVGDGRMMGQLKGLCTELDVSENVFFYGGQSNPYRYIKNAHFLFIPSVHEAAPLVIDEARCLGIPVLSTETTSSEEMITHRNCGWVCGNTQECINEKLYDVTADRDGIAKMKSAISTAAVFDNDMAVKMFKQLID